MSEKCINQIKTLPVYIFGYWHVFVDFIKVYCSHFHQELPKDP